MIRTPIFDFVKTYTASAPVRLHMPGHKGRGPLGCEALDLTEIPGADSLYEAAGVIAESEANASALFGCPTFYSTEGSSHCIRAMLLLAEQVWRWRHSKAPAHDAEESGFSAQLRTTGRGGFFASLRMTGRDGFRVLAARNAHKAFLSAAALLDLDVCWLPADADSYLSADPTPEALDAALTDSGAAAVYLTCPDYLGNLPDLQPLAAVCHAHGALLLVDNAHGAYLRFLTPSRHPMSLGADLCCDSAHKTLPVLTGGAYLHVAAGMLQASAKKADAGQEARPLREDGSRFGVQTTAPQGGAGQKAEPGPLCTQSVREALALFGSTSPSYLILQSLDLANPDLETLPARLAAFLPRIAALKARLCAAGWRLIGDEPLKLTFDLRPSPATDNAGVSSGPPRSGTALAAALEQAGIFCEFADRDFLVLMVSPEHTEAELARLEAALTAPESRMAEGRTSDACPYTDTGEAFAPLHRLVPEVVCTIREAMLAPAVSVPAAESLGRVLARPGVSCPPAVPILMPGERIDEAAVAAFRRYRIETVSVLQNL